MQDNGAGLTDLMKNGLFKIILFCLLALQASCAWGLPFKAAIDPTDMSVGARPFGMGKAFTAISDDCNAIFMNPSGLAQTTGWEMTSMYANLLGEINYTMLGASWGSGKDAFGIGYLMADIGDSQIVSHRDPNTGRIVPTGEGAIGYLSSVAVLSYGGSLRRLIDMQFADDISFGASVKIFNQQLEGGTYEALASGADLDVGALWNTNKWLKFGAFGQNILSKDSGGVLRWTSGIEEDIPYLWKIGASAKLLGTDAPWEFNAQSLFCDLDYELSSKVNRPGLVHLGLEWWPIEYLALRCGVDEDAVSTGDTDAGIGVDNNLTAGLGLYWGGFEFDYAFHQFGTLSENNTHFFSMSFAPPKETPLPPPPPPPVKEKFINSVYPGKEIVLIGGDLVISGEVEPEVKIVKAGEATAEALGGRFNIIIPIASVGKKKFELEVYNEGGRKLDGTEIKVLRLPSFSDVPESYWNRQTISLIAAIGFAQGYPNGTFKPDGEITRAELATMLVRAGGEPLPLVTEKKLFNDVTGAHWAASFIKKGIIDRLVKGYPDGTFKPGNNINRAEGVSLVARFDKLSEPEVIYSKPFPDLPLTHWAIKIISAAKEKGILDYLKDKSFEPKKNMSRAESAEMISRTTLAKQKIDAMLDFGSGY